MNQAMDMMGGLVLGIEAKARRGAATVADAVNARNLHLVVRISRQPWRKVTHLWRDLRRRARATLSAIRTLTNCGSNKRVFLAQLLCSNRGRRSILNAASY